MTAKTPMPHAEIIKACADDASLKIEGRPVETEFWQDVNLSWVAGHLAWYYRIKPEPRTFEMWHNIETGSMTPFDLEGNSWYGNMDRYERITVQEVLA